MSDPSSIDQHGTAILDALAERQPATASELASELETHPTTIERHCRTLECEGYLRRSRGGGYTVAGSIEEAKAALTE